MPTMQGTDAWTPRAGRSATATSRGCTSPPVWSRWARASSREYGFSPSAEHPRLGPVRSPWNTDHTAGASLGRLGRDGRGRRRPDRARERRRRLDPDPGRRQRAGRAQADPRPARPGRDDAPDAGPDRQPTASSPGACATPRRSSARPRRSTARCTCRRSATSPARAARRLRIGVHTQGVGRSATPEVTELTLKTAALLEELGHRVEQVDAPVGAVVPGRLPPLLVEPGAVPPARAGAGCTVGRGSPSKLDNLTHGLPAHAAAQPAPAARRDPPAAPQQRASARVLHELRRAR